VLLGHFDGARFRLRIKDDTFQEKYRRASTPGGAAVNPRREDLKKELIQLLAIPPTAHVRLAKSY
jgi:hypothetical protein